MHQRAERLVHERVEVARERLEQRAPRAAVPPEPLAGFGGRAKEERGSAVVERVGRGGGRLHPGEPARGEVEPAEQRRRAASGWIAEHRSWRKPGRVSGSVARAAAHAVRAARGRARRDPPRRASPPPRGRSGRSRPRRRRERARERFSASRDRATCALARTSAVRAPARPPASARRARSAARPRSGSATRSTSARSARYATSHATAATSPPPSTRTEIQLPGANTAQAMASRAHRVKAVSPAARSDSASTLAAASKSCHADGEEEHPPPDLERARAPDAGSRANAGEDEIGRGRGTRARRAPATRRPPRRRARRAPAPRPCAPRRSPARRGWRPRSRSRTPA